jgi:hypothetical protein
MKPDAKQPDPWAACTWEGARAETLRRGQRLTFREKIIWLEQAARLSRSFRIRKGQPQNSAKPRGGPGGHLAGDS